MQTSYFDKVDLTSFWYDSEYALKAYVEAPPTDELIASVEQELGYKLPASYIALMKLHNGGIPNNTCFPTEEATSWAEDHVAVTGIMGIGRKKINSLCGQLGSRFMQKEWGYPDIGVCICNCPSAGHDMIMLDYSACGKTGEPTVVHVNQEDDYKITYLAPDFASFINGLVSEEEFDESEEELEDDLESIKSDDFSLMLKGFFSKEEKNFETILRNLLTSLTREKGYFALHADEQSYLAYDIQFYLYSRHQGTNSVDDYLEQYPEMIAMASHAVSTHGYAPDFVTDWLQKRLEDNNIMNQDNGQLVFTHAYQLQLLDALKQYE